ncbi:MAG: VWA domain-containing protein, partial [Bryobacteraceae bacterium]
MKRWPASLLAMLPLAAPSLIAENKVASTVIDARTGAAVTGLKAADFTILEDKTPRPILAVEYTTEKVDVMMLLDTSLVGEMVRPVAADLIAQLDPKEQMAVVSFHSAADLIQDFTSSRELLGRSLASVKYGNDPRVLDALYAAIDGGFRSTTLRRVALLLTAGVEGNSRVSERQVVNVARRNGVSIYPVYVIGYERSMLENLARQTGGATFNLRDLRKREKGPLGARIFEAVRSRYTLTLSGYLALGEK